MLLTGVAFPQQSWRSPCRLGDIWNQEKHRPGKHGDAARTESSGPVEA